MWKSSTYWFQHVENEDREWESAVMGYLGTCHGSWRQEKALRPVVSQATDPYGWETP